MEPGVGVPSMYSVLLCWPLGETERGGQDEVGTWCWGTGEPLKAVCREGDDQQTTSAPLRLGLALRDGPSWAKDGDLICPIEKGRQDLAKGAPG